MTDNGDRRPWWYSGGAEAEPAPDSAPEAGTDPDPDADDGAPDSGMDWSMLVAGAQRMVDWATERVMAPHAEHDDPAQYPQCVVCRTLLLVGDSGGLPDVEDGLDRDEAPDGPAPIVWIPIREDGGRPASDD